MSMTSEQLFERSQQLVPGGVHSPVRSFKGLHTTPRFVERTNGAHLFDEEGKDYIDFCMSFGPLILGHRNPKVEQAMINALQRGWSYGACEKYSLNLAEFIIDRIPFIEKIRFVNSGTEAVMTALRLARGYTKKEKIIKFNGCYHGHLDSMLIKAGSGLAGTMEASSAGVTKHTADNTLVCELGSIEQVKQCFAKYPNDIAAIFIEPLPANNGLLPQTREFIQQLKDIAHENGALIVFDEVISGFRISFGGMAQQLEIEPDIVTYGKIIGGGMPVGAVASSAKIMDHLAPSGSVYQAGTLSANPLAMEAGLATLKELSPEAYETLEKSTTQICNLLKKWCNENGFEDYNFTQHGSLFWACPQDKMVQNASEIPGNLQDRFYHLFKVLLDKGIYLAPNAYEVGFVSLAHNELVIQELEKRLWK